MAEENSEVSSGPSLSLPENSTETSKELTETTKSITTTASEVASGSSVVNTEPSEVTAETSDTTAANTIETPSEASEIYSNAIFTEFEVIGPETVETDINQRTEITRDDILRSTERRLKAEDESWAVCPVNDLQDICIKYVADHFIEIGVTKIQSSVNEEQWQKIMKFLPLDLPYEDLLPLLKDETYWKRRCVHSWGSLNLKREPWRQYFAEMTVQKVIESFIPFVTDPAELRKAKKTCKDFVRSLTIRKLQLVPKEIEREGEEDEEEDEVQLPIPYSLPNHMDVGSVLVCFPKLEEVYLCLAPHDCGSDYEFSDYQLTTDDVDSLTKSLKKIPCLQAFRLSGCHVFGYLVQKLCEVVKSSPLLKLLELSYAVLDSKSCRILARVLMDGSSLETLILSYNTIGDEGIVFLGAALTKNSTLKILSVKLNGIGEKGGTFLAQCLERNQTLESLDISGNLLGEKSGLAFAHMIEVSQSLKCLNLSSNKMGGVAGDALKAAVENNFILKECDVRLCDLGQKAETAIKQCIFRNCTEGATNITFD